VPFSSFSCCLPAAPCLEFAGAENAYASNDSCARMVGNAKVLYYDNRYW